MDHARIRVRHAGEGPAVLLLHGHPRTGSTWHAVEGAGEGSRPVSPSVTAPWCLHLTPVSTPTVTSMTEERSTVRQLRVVIEAEDYDAATRFFHDTLGMPAVASFSQDDDAEVVILDAGHATLEIANAPHKRYIDEVEAEGRPSPWIRLALEVGDSQSTTEKAQAAGADLVAAPRLTPWQSVNSRLDVPSVPGLQITFFAETLDQKTRDSREGFTK